MEIDMWGELRYSKFFLRGEGLDRAFTVCHSGSHLSKLFSIVNKFYMKAVKEFSSSVCKKSLAIFQPFPEFLLQFKAPRSHREPGKIARLFSEIPWTFQAFSRKLISSLTYTKACEILMRHFHSPTH